MFCWKCWNDRGWTRIAYFVHREYRIADTQRIDAICQIIYANEYIVASALCAFVSFFLWILLVAHFSSQRVCEIFIFLSEGSVALHQKMLSIAQQFTFLHADGWGSLVSVVGALVAIRKRVGVRVVEQRVVPVTPRKLLQGDAADSSPGLDSVAGRVGAGRRRLTLVRMRR